MITEYLVHAVYNEERGGQTAQPRQTILGPAEWVVSLVRY